MKAILSSVSLFFLSFCLVAQNISPFRFENYTPKWIHICRSDSIPNDFQTLQVDNLQNGGAMTPLVHEGKMYVVMNVVKEYYDGYLIEKINLESGEEEWEDLYYTNERHKRRYAQTAEIKNDLLDVIIFTENNKPDHNLWPAWFHGNLNLHSYDQESGRVVSSTNNKPSDSASYYINMPETLIFKNTITTRAYASDTGFDYLIYQIRNTSQKTTNAILQNVHFTKDEKLIDSSLSRITFPYTFNAWRVRDLPNGNILFSINTRSEDKGDFDFSFLILNRYHETISHINLTNQLEPADFHSLVYCDSTHIVIGSLKQVPFQNYLINLPDKLYLFDLDGNLIGKTDMDGLYLPDHFPGLTSTIIYEHEVPLVLTSVSYELNGLHHFDFYKWGSDGILKKVKSIHLDDPDKLLRINVMMIHKDDLICQFSYRDIPNSPPNSRTFVAYAAIPLTDLLTGTNENIKQGPVMQITPNPAKDFVMIENFTDELVICNITNSLGQEVPSHPMKGNTMYVGHLNPGIYFITVMDSEMGSSTLQFVKQ